MLATSYYRANLVRQAHWLLKEKSPRSAQCRFLEAKCAYQLKDYTGAECALTNGGFGDMKNFDDIIKDFDEIACFVLQLIAQICIKTERTRIAAEALRRALKLNPFMWQAFADLCQLGEAVDPQTVFHIASTDIFSTCQGNINSMVLVGGGGGGGPSPNDTVSLCDCTPSVESLGNNLSSATYILATPLELPQTQANTPANNSNLNNTITLLRGGGAQNTTTNSSVAFLEDTSMGQCNETVAATTANETPDSGAGTPFRKQFKYLYALSPMTPSFGVLPIISPCPADTSGSGQSLTNLSSYSSPLPQTLVKVNQETKPVAKKVRGHVSSGLMNRKDSTSNSGSNKPAVFTQTGNITPRTPGNATGSGMPNAAVRRSSRLFSNNYSVKENNKTPNIPSNKFAQPRSPPRKTKTRITKICLNNEIIDEKTSNPNNDKLNDNNAKRDKEKVETITSATTVSRDREDTKVLLNNSLNNAQTMAHQVLTLKKQSADGLMALLRDLGEGYRHLTQYQCKEVIRSLETAIPKHQLCTSWVQSLIGMAHYELREYESAVSVFKRIHEMEPCRLDYMDIYSSSLWHLQREVDLSALSQDLMNQDKTSPLTWCVAGNCFSLHKEHETAIKFFKRAVQVDPDFVYSYTLLGHELVITEELDKALDFFRAAVVRDPRHYNAWFGIGTIYSKQEKYELAELHYIRALNINPQNSVIMVHIGAMQYFMQKKEQALQTLNSAATLDPKNPLARFHRGSIYYSLGKHQEALNELEELKEIVPKESVVFYLIGKIHKALGNIDSALMHFSWATDLDPKGANNQIKDAFDSMSHPNCCPSSSGNDPSLDGDLEPTSEPSDDSIQAQQDINYDSDVY